MAEKKETTAKTKEETRVVHLPRVPGPSANQDQYVAVNGKAYIVKRGMDVEVPLSVYEVLQHAAIAEDKAAEYAEEMAVKEPGK